MSRQPLLSLSNISLGFGQERLFDDLDLVIHENERICLVGRNGSGKSSLLKVIADLIPSDDGERVVRKGVSVGYLDQDPDLTPFKTLRDFATSDLDLNEAYQVDIVAEGLKVDLDKSPSTASGGECRRAALCKIIAEQADLMLFDEPTNHLDIEAVLYLEDYLRQLNSAYVLISHDRAFLRSLTRSTLWVDRGKVRRLNKGFEAFEDWRDETYAQEDLEQHKLKRLIKAEAKWAVEGISARRKRNQGRVRRLQGLRQEQSDFTKRERTADLALQTSALSGKKVIEAKDISKSFGEGWLFKNLSLKINRQDRIGIIGPNGVGKTTLLKTLIGELAPDEGSIQLGTKLEIAVFDQTRAELDLNESLWENLTLDKELGVVGKSDHIMVRGTARHVMGYLKDFLFTEEQARGPARVLSGGEKARLLLAKIMALPSNLLILDEPTNDLDVETLDLLQEILDSYDGTVLLVSHDRDFLDRVATRTVAFEGQAQVVLTAGGWTDYQSQRPNQMSSPIEKGTRKKTVNDKVKTQKQELNGLTFSEKDRLEKLPELIERMEFEISKLEEFLMQPDLFTQEPDKFAKASEGLAERQLKLQELEVEWLSLEDKNST